MEPRWPAAPEQFGLARGPCSGTRMEIGIAKVGSARAPCLFLSGRPLHARLAER